MIRGTESGMDEMLTTKELAELLRLNEKKVYQLVRDGGVPHVRIAGKWLFPRKHVMRWLDEQVHRERDIRIMGSDDVLVDRLISLYSREQYPESMAFYAAMGSTKGIDALSRKKGHACCTHILDTETGEYNLPVLARLMPDRQYVVINLWYRKQGLIVKKGNPLGIGSLADVARRKATFINRNKGSGTRVLLEYLLGEEEIDERDITGFTDEVDSHLGVALRVLFGEADAGVGIEYVTHPLGLDFVPIREERFDLVVPKELWSTGIVREFVSYLDPPRIKKISRNLPGYDLRETGKVIFEG